MGQVIVLDTRELEHPVPFEQAVRTFARITGDELIHMIHRRNPVPLFEFLDNQPAASYRSHQDAEGTWHIFIRKNGELGLEDFDV